ncbi:MAG: hypothetical protein RR513_04595 [Muribaculaceae bacterium]
MSFLSGCFTGVENTKKISEKDVNKLAPGKVSKEQSYIDSVVPSTLTKWEKGEEFYVTDNQAKLIFLPSVKYNLDTISFQGRILKYKGYIERNILGDESTVNLMFTDKNNNEYSHATNKTFTELNDADKGVVIPFMISLNLVAKAQTLLKGKDLYIKTALWYDADDELINGTKFVKVHVIDVFPGNKTFPLKIEFEYNEAKAFAFVSTPNSPIVNRTFESLFSFKDIRNQYPTITDENWERITKSLIALEMTKEECRLALGAPKKIDQRPTYEGLREAWSYENGIYLVFEDGILRSYRK